MNYTDVVLDFMLLYSNNNKDSLLYNPNEIHKDELNNIILLVWKNSHNKIYMTIEFLYNTDETVFRYKFYDSISNVITSSGEFPTTYYNIELSLILNSI